MLIEPTESETLEEVDRYILVFSVMLATLLTVATLSGSVTP